MTETASSYDPIVSLPRGRASEAELEASAVFLHRLTNRPLTVTRTLLLWADEVVIFRTAVGEVNGVHGFRFADLKDDRGAYRLVYAVFSHSEGDAAAKTKQAGQVGVRIYGRERRERPDAAIVWANAPGCDPDLSFATGALRPVRRLVPGTHSRLPQNMRFTTDAVEVASSAVPGSVDDAVALLLREQRERQGDAAMGRQLLRPTWTKLVAGLTVATAAAALILIPRHQAETAVVSTREKGGGPALRVFRQEGVSGVELVSGSPASPGDKVQFAVDLPDTQRVRVVGVESDGELYQAWPLPGTSPADIVTAGRGWVLDGARVLDGSRGRETLYLVSCPREVEQPICVSQGPDRQPVCPAKCALSPFVLDKVPR